MLFANDCRFLEKVRQSIKPDDGDDENQSADEDEESTALIYLLTGSSQEQKSVMSPDEG